MSDKNSCWLVPATFGWYTLADWLIREHLTGLHNMNSGEDTKLFNNGFHHVVAAHALLVVSVLILMPEVGLTLGAATGVILSSATQQGLVELCAYIGYWLSQILWVLLLLISATVRLTS